MLGIVGEGHGVERHDHDVAEHQQRVEPGGEQAVAERARDEGDRAALAREGQRQPDIGVGREQGQDAAKQEREPGGALRLRTREADGREDAAADDPADADRKCTDDAEVARRRRGAGSGRWQGQSLAPRGRCRDRVPPAPAVPLVDADPGCGDHQQDQRDRLLVPLNLAQEQLDRMAEQIAEHPEWRGPKHGRNRVEHQKADRRDARERDGDQPGRGDPGQEADPQDDRDLPAVELRAHLRHLRGPFGPTREDLLADRAHAEEPGRGGSEVADRPRQDHERDQLQPAAMGREATEQHDRRAVGEAAEDQRQIAVLREQAFEIHCLPPDDVTMPLTSTIAKRGSRVQVEHGGSTGGEPEGEQPHRQTDPGIQPAPCGRVGEQGRNQPGA